MTGFYLHQFLLLFTALTRMGASGLKPAARLGIDWRGQLAFQNLTLGGVVNIHGRNGGKQCLRVRMANGSGEQNPWITKETNAKAVYVPARWDRYCVNDRKGRRGGWSLTSFWKYV